VGVVVRMDDRHGIAVKWNDDGGWSSDGDMLSLVRKRWWCRFNASVLTREGRQQDVAFSKDKAEAAILT
jgi:hypothetical protein